MEAFESSITFCHILSQPFPNNNKHGSFLKVLLFPSGSFYSMKQGLIVSCGNIPKLCLCRFVLCGYLVIWPSVMHDKSSITIGHPFACEFYTKCARCSRIMWPSLYAGYFFDAELALPVLQHSSLSLHLSGSLFDFLYPDDFQISYVAFHSWCF